MNPGALPNRGHISPRTPRGCENPAGAVRRNWLVWKPTTRSFRSILAAVSFLAEWSPRFVLLYGTSPVPCIPRQSGCLARLCYADPTRSAVLRLLRSSSNTTPALFAHKPFSLHELPSVVRRRGLTSRTPERYIAVRRGRARRGGLTESPNGPVAGLSPEIMESAV